VSGEGDHLPTRSGFNQGPSLVVHLGLVGTRIWAGFCDQRWVGRELRFSRPAFASSSRQGASVEHACTAAYMEAKLGCSESTRCAYHWHVKRSTNNKVQRRAVQSQTGEGLAGRRQQIEVTQL